MHIALKQYANQTIFQGGHVWSKALAPDLMRTSSSSV